MTEASVIFVPGRGVKKNPKSAEIIAQPVPMAADLAGSGSWSPDADQRVQE